MPVDLLLLLVVSSERKRITPAAAQSQLSSLVSRASEEKLLALQPTKRAQVFSAAETQHEKTKRENASTPLTKKQINK